VAGLTRNLTHCPLLSSSIPPPESTHTRTQFFLRYCSFAASPFLAPSRPTPPRFTSCPLLHPHSVAEHTAASSSPIATRSCVASPPSSAIMPPSPSSTTFKKLCAYNFLQSVTRALGWPSHLFSVTHASIAVDACWPNWWGAHTDT
jgi:hypothetical protein